MEGSPRPVLLSAAEAAARLGVKRETLYAYVSRGVLRRSSSSVGRASWFDERDVERLRAERGGRQSLPARSRPGFDLAIASAVTTIARGRLSYRGRDLGALVRGANGAGKQARQAGPPGSPATSFEAVAELLWTGQLPAERPPWSANAALLAAIDPVVRALPAQAHPADRLRVATAAAAAADPLRVDLRPAAVRATGRDLLIVLAEALRSAPRPGPAEPGGGPAREGAEQAREPSVPAGGDPPPIAVRLASSLGVGVAWVGALETALVVLADHELATSTLAARVAASTRADPYQVVLAGLAAVSGPLHGLASARVGRLFRAAGEGAAGPEQAVADELREHGLVPGFGQTQYPDGDPRAPLLLDAVRAVPSEAALEAVLRAEQVAAAVARRAAIAPNIDFALATLVAAAGCPPELGEALFALARVAGWVAHALEEYDEPPLRYRLRAVPPARPDEATDTRQEDVASPSADETEPDAGSRRFDVDSA
jgi:citrate synthase